MQLQERRTSHDVPRRPDSLVRARDPVTIALDVLEQHRLSPIELRILLALQDGEADLTELADRFDRRTQTIRRSAGALFARGLLHWRYVDGGAESVFSLTYAGRAVVRPLRAAKLAA